MNRLLLILSILIILNIYLSEINCLHITNHYHHNHYNQNNNNHYNQNNNNPHNNNNHHHNNNNNNHHHNHNLYNLYNKASHRYYNLQQTTRVSQSRSIQYLNMCKDLCLSMHKIFPFQFKYHRLVYRQQIGNLKYFIGNCLYTFRNNQNKQQNQNQDDSNNNNINDQDNNETINNMTINTKQLNLQVKQQSNSNQQQQNTTNLHKQHKYQQHKQKKQQLNWLSWEQLKQFIQIFPIHNQQYMKQLQTWQSYYNDCQDQTLKLQQQTKQQLKFNIIHSNFQYYQQNGFQNLSPFNDIETFITQINIQGNNI